MLATTGTGTGSAWRGLVAICGWRGLPARPCNAKPVARPAAWSLLPGWPCNAKPVARPVAWSRLAGWSLAKAAMTVDDVGGDA